MRTWIVAFDFSPHARAALDMAAGQLDAMGGGNLCILHVHQPTSGPDGGIDLGLFGAPGELERAYIEEAERELKKNLDEQRVRYPKLSITTRLESGNPADTVVRVAGEQGAEQIVVGSHGRRGFQRFFLGSVAERIARKADCTVLVVKQPPT
jgi:nucleotide-binding universal stress UspA family protein